VAVAVGRMVVFPGLQVEPPEVKLEFDSPPGRFPLDEGMSVMRISELLKSSLIKVDLMSDDKDELFEEMVQIFVNNDLLRDRDAALDAIRGREEKMSTGIGKGLALPHGKVKELSGLLMALGISRSGIEYDALDGQPVNVVIMVLAEAGNPGPHIEALAEISRLFSLPGFLDKIRQCRTVQEVVEAIRREE
jgi:mannitol/fructose-specific phosphotransferase system IIA component (Ntr-type)